MPYTFADNPDAQDYERLAEHLERADSQQLHPALYPQRHLVAQALRQLAEPPFNPQSLSKYHALRLFVK